MSSVAAVGRKALIEVVETLNGIMEVLTDNSVAVIAGVLAFSVEVQVLIDEVEASIVEVEVLVREVIAVIKAKKEAMKSDRVMYEAV